MALVDVEVTICSARDLKNVNWKHGDLCAYAVVWIDERGNQPIMKVTTRVDAHGDTSPSWDEKFTLSVAKAKLEEAHLVVEIYHDKAEDPLKAIVGSSSLALLEAVDVGGYDEVHDHTLKLKRPSGRPHGKLKMAIRLRERRGAYSAHPPPPEGASPYIGQRDWQSSAYPGYNPQIYPASQPYAQVYPAAQPYAGYSYGGSPSYEAPRPYASYAPPPPQPYGSYGPPQPYGVPSPYTQTPPPYQEAPPPYQAAPPAQKQGSKFGGIGAGLAVGALAGAVGGLALGEYIEDKEDEAAEEQREEDDERYAELEAGRDDDYGGGGDGGYGDY